MGKEGQKSSGLSELVYFLWLAKMAIPRTGHWAKVATPRTGHQWPKCFVNPLSNQYLSCCLLQNVHLSMVNGAQHGTVSEIWDLHPGKFRSVVLCASNFMILPQINKLISSSELTSHEKNLEIEKPELSCTNTWSLSKVLPKFMESLSWFLSKKKTEPGLDLKNFKCAPAHFFLGGAICRRDAWYVTHFRAYFCASLLISYHAFKLAVSAEAWYSQAVPYLITPWQYMPRLGHAILYSRLETTV